MKPRRKSAQPRALDPALGIGTLKSQIAIVEADNPLYAPIHAGAAGNPKKISVAFNLRESPIAMMSAKGHIDAAQLAAANKFRMLFEAMGGAGAGALDYSREPVDGGGVREPITDRQIDAGIQLKRVQTVLGMRAFKIVERVAGEGFGISDLYHSHRERTTAADMLKFALTDLAALWGFASKRN